MSSSVSPASATAARQASTASDSGSTISRRPMRRPPDAGQHDAVLEAVVAERRPRASGGTGSGTRSTGSVAPVGSNSGSHTSSCCSKRTATSWPMCTSSGSQPTMLVVRWTRRVLGERDVGDHVRRLEAGQPLVLVDREADDRGPPRHRGRRPRAAAARAGRSAPAGARAPAVGAALDAQVPVGARRPEPLVDRRELGERAHAAARSELAAEEADGVARRLERRRSCRRRSTRSR